MSAPYTGCYTSWRIGINLQAAKTLFIKSIFYQKNSTTTIACWYMNPHFDETMQTSFFWCDSGFIWTRVNATVYLSVNTVLCIETSIYSSFDLSTSVLSRILTKGSLKVCSKSSFLFSTSKIAETVEVAKEILRCWKCF